MNHLIITFGWLWMIGGILLGMIIGLWAESSEWAGGYGSLKRRALRLAHISAIALPALCVLYGQTMPSSSLASSLQATGACLMIAGTILMPLVCVGTAFVNRVKFLFPIPATAIFVAVALMAWGQIVSFLYE
jgi:hypothetical protein